MSLVVDIILGIVFIGFLFAGVLGLLFGGIDRRLYGRFQGRMGPPILQPFFDLGKLFSKETFRVGSLFRLGPIVSIASSVTLMLYLPIGINPVLVHGGDLIVILFLLTLAPLGLAIGGLASNSVYGTLGAQREIALIASYELPLAAVIFGLAWRVGLVTGQPFVLTSFEEVNIWLVGGPIGALGVIILLAALLTVIPGIIGVSPFDVTEAETEIAGGALVEYSGAYYGLYVLALAILSVAVTSLTVSIFFPAGLSPLFGLTGISGAALDVGFHVLKIFAVFLLAITLTRTLSGRYRITQAVRAYWLTITPLSILGIILLAVPVMI